jgi:hypothetical protein
MGNQRCTITRIGPPAFPIRSQYNYAEVVRHTNETFHCRKDILRNAPLRIQCGGEREANEKVTPKA